MDYFYWRLHDNFLEVCFSKRELPGMNKNNIMEMEVHDAVAMSQIQLESADCYNNLKAVYKAEVNSWDDVDMVQVWISPSLLPLEEEVERFDDNVILNENGTTSRPLLHEWVHAMKTLGQRVSKMQDFVLLVRKAGAPGTENYFPLSALTAMLKETPEIRKIDAYALLLGDHPHESSDFNSTVNHKCRFLEAITYGGSKFRRAPRLQDREGPLAASLLAVPRLRSLSFIGLVFSEEYSHTFITCSHWKKLAHLRLNVVFDTNIMTSVTKIVSSNRELVELDLGIAPCKTCNPVRKEHEDAMYDLTSALQASNVAIIKLRTHGSLLNEATMASWTNMLKHNYKLQEFSINIDISQPLLGDPYKHSDDASNTHNKWTSQIQSFVNLNKNGRKELFSNFETVVASPSLWVHLIKEVCSMDGTAEDVLTSLYLLIGQNAGSITNSVLSAPPFQPKSSGRLEVDLGGSHTLSLLDIYDVERERHMLLKALNSSEREHANLVGYLSGSNLCVACYVLIIDASPDSYKQRATICYAIRQNPFTPKQFGYTKIDHFRRNLNERWNKFESSRQRVVNLLTLAEKTLASLAPRLPTRISRRANKGKRTTPRCGEEPVPLLEAASAPAQESPEFIRVSSRSNKGKRIRLRYSEEFPY